MSMESRVESLASVSLYLVSLDGGNLLIQGNKVANLYLKEKRVIQQKKKNRRESFVCNCVQLGL